MAQKDSQTEEWENKKTGKERREKARAKEKRKRMRIKKGIATRQGLLNGY